MKFIPKILIVCSYFIANLVWCAKEEQQVTHLNVEAYINKTILTLNSSYEDLNPELQFAALITQKAAKRILKSVQFNIFEGLQTITFASDNINFTDCVKEIPIDKYLHVFNSCLTNKSDIAMKNINHAYSNVRKASVSGLQKIQNSLKACDDCTDLADSFSKTLYTHMVKLVSNATEYILSEYRNVVNYMPECAVELVDQSTKLSEIFECVLLGIQKKN